MIVVIVLILLHLILLVVPTPSYGIPLYCTQPIPRSEVCTLLEFLPQSVLTMSKLAILYTMSSILSKPTIISFLWKSFSYGSLRTIVAMIVVSYVYLMLYLGYGPAISAKQGAILQSMSLKIFMVANFWTIFVYSILTLMTYFSRKAITHSLMMKPCVTSRYLSTLFSSRQLFPTGLLFIPR